jgi:hypothetical protein
MFFHRVIIIIFLSVITDTYYVFKLIELTIKLLLWTNGFLCQFVGFEKLFFYFPPFILYTCERIFQRDIEIVNSQFFFFFFLVRRCKIY